MSLKLKLENDEIKEYATVFEVAGGEGGPATYSTKCGLKQHYPIHPHEECDHLDCAIDVTINDINLFKFGLKFFAILLPLSILIDRSRIMFWISFWGMMMLILLPIYGWSAYWSSEKQKELKEFRDHGTINGIKAHEIITERDINGSKATT